MKFDFREKNKLRKFWGKAAVVIFALTAHCSLLTAHSFAQGGSQNYKSPLYSPRVYEDDRQGTTTSDGLPRALNEVGIEQKLNEQLPLDAKFVDDAGREVALGEYFGKKPVVLALVYYECPMLCNEVLNGLTRSLKGMNFTVGKEFDVVAVSFDPKDRPEIARAKKESYIAKYGNAESAAGWHFLTGSPESIEKITKAVGFKYHWDEESKQFAHAGGIQVVTPEGKLARYYYGIDYAPKEVKFGLMEASANKIGNSVDQLLLYCYHYDPASGKYGLAIMRVVRIAGLVTIFGLAAMLLVLWRRGGQNRNEKTA